MQSDILFDNIYIGHSTEDAAALAAETYEVKRAIEDAEEAKAKPKVDEKPKSPMELAFKDDPVAYVKEKLDLFITIAKKDPVEAIKFMPEVAGGIGAVVVTIIALLVGLFGMGTKSAPSKTETKKTATKEKAAVVDTKGEAVDAAASGAETVKSEVNKRTTRSAVATE